MTLTQADFEAQLQAAIDDYEIQERYKAQSAEIIKKIDEFEQENNINLAA
ncbi:hypothetical protein ABTD06_08780 [Acinetobacter baumannii]